jgi:hypothetical protein
MSNTQGVFIAVLVLGLGTAVIAQPPAGRGGAQAAARQAALMQYAGAWNKTTEAEILAALKNCWTPESTYTDPQTDTARGPAALAQVILGFHKAAPGATIVPTSGLDVHHNYGRFSWRLTRPAANGAPSQDSDGFDFVEFSADGTKVLKIVGFFGPFPKP